MTIPEMVYEEHARNCAEDAFWAQVRRTVNGQPVSDDQIEMIVRQMQRLLDVSVQDCFLDICSGNGALTDRVFANCRSGVGVDISPSLIAIARKHFPMGGRVQHVEEDAIRFLATAGEPGKFDKAMLYGAVGFLRRDQVERLLRLLRNRFPAMTRVVIGNVADRDKLHDFFRPADYSSGIEDDPGSPIGIWWSEQQFRDLADETGWAGEFHRMPEGFYASRYRYDVVLRPL